MRNRVAFVLMMAALPSMVFGITAPALPLSDFADTEVSTNLVLNQGAMSVSGLNLRLEFTGTASNNVEVVLGTDADHDGALSFDESGVRLGWDCGRYFIERMQTGERYEETNVGTDEFARVLDWQCVVRRHTLKSLAITTEAGAGFSCVTTNAPSWLYDRDWNLIQLTARGVDMQNEQFDYEVTQRGILIMLK